MESYSILSLDIGYSASFKIFSLIIKVMELTKELLELITSEMDIYLT